MTISIPDGLHSLLGRIKRGVWNRRASAGLDLSGDRGVEWSWVAARIPQGPGEALDFGCGASDLGLIAAHRGFNVTGIDLDAVARPYHHERLAFVQGDLLEMPFEESRFDLVINCSAVEHVGLPGRYGIVRERRDGDLEAMERMRALMKAGGTMLLTVPVGQDAVFAPWHRVYGAERLPRLLEGYVPERREFWCKGSDNRWVPREEAAALAVVARERLYGLGCFVLRKP